MEYVPFVLHLEFDKILLHSLSYGIFFQFNAAFGFFLKI